MQSLHFTIIINIFALVTKKNKIISYVFLTHWRCIPGIILLQEYNNALTYFIDPQPDTCLNVELTQNSLLACICGTSTLLTY